MQTAVRLTYVMAALVTVTILAVVVTTAVNVTVARELLAAALPGEISLLGMLVGYSAHCSQARGASSKTGEQSKV